MVTDQRRPSPSAVRNWLIGARLKTLPATFAPIAVGTAIAHSLGQVSWWRTALTVVFALSFVIGTNFLNDYSDGVRGADTHRVGPVRLVGSGQATPRQVLRSGMVLYALAALTGVLMAVTISWWLLALTAFCALGGWFYTGGSRPYGYRGLGEVSVFLFHGVIAVCATAYIQLGRVPLLALSAAVPIGLLVCALLVTNNLRDIPTDAAAGKITLAVRLGDRRTRRLYVFCVETAFAWGPALAMTRPWALLVFAAVPFAVFPLRRVVTGARGADLIAALEHTCLLLLVFGALLAIGLAR
ncbi:1,4-dihydroxy-2-naphthoate polyprenyltransferase [Streptomyces sp. NBS 14/10]|uniref:1,4-dihydroxy-2-naphthoate polyprenyltransferase n=1 Tax=Streptomyces sp. NBS 14/10 TaxID=1945643 RepID=UPI000B7DC9F6|nr:1,4-dihydroxy-2-naphthoate polyprenyltransferase [Streptomyces sp. NBS 14/10]KAK1184898.1 1,4-dihydroxy-2-naphthoate polyprenyltransferase [Streptomyces sp. NBS 14/10]